MAEVQDAANAPAAAAPPAAEGEKKDENWKFIPAQPIREDQVQNAVNFLSHPKVKGSPVVYRRSFLERKGLTREEIDEAFRRVPDPPSDSKSGQIPAAPSVSAQQISSPALAPAPSPAPQLVSATPQQALVPRRKGPSWTQMAIAIGLLSAAGAGAAVATKKYLFPRMKAWLRRIVLDEEQISAIKKQQAMELEAAKASAANNAVGEMVALVRELMNSKMEERRYFDGVLSSLEAQTKEIKLSLETQTREIKRSLSTIDAHLQKTSSTVSEANGFVSHDQYKASMYDGQATKANAGASEQPRAVRTSPAPAANNPPHSTSYLEIMAMLERGEKPPNIREVNDKPPNANQPPSSSVLQPKAKQPWETPRDDKAEETGPWWQQRPKDKRVENTVKIVEIEAEEGSSSGMNGGVYEPRPAWVPPPVPRTLLPGVDAAIRHKAPIIEPESPFSKPIQSAANGGNTSSSSSSSAFPEEIQPVIEEAPITQKVTILEADQNNVSDKPEDVVVSDKPEDVVVSSEVPGY